MDEALSQELELLRLFCRQGLLWQSRGESAPLSFFCATWPLWIWQEGESLWKRAIGSFHFQVEGGVVGCGDAWLWRDLGVEREGVL